MEFLHLLIVYVVPFLVVLTVLVFVHELGHYLVARRSGVRVEVFSIGFGPELFGWNDRAGTRWKVSALPFGGYVKMFGEYDMDEEAETPRPLTPEEQAVSFKHKRLSQRAAVVAAGPIANFIFAIVVLAGLFAVVGTPRPLAGVGSILPNSAAAAAGLEKGDRIVSVDGVKIKWFEDLSREISSRPDKQITLGVVRNGSQITLDATPKRVQVEDEAGKTIVIGRLGVGPDPDQVNYVRVGPLTASGMAVERSYDLVVQILSYVGQMVTGKQSAKELGGPIRIAQISGQMAQGGFANLVFFMAMLSINLGLINLFPIPMLDGGHLVFYLAEAVRGRPLDQRFQEYGFRFGLILVLLLMVFVTWNDLIQLKVFEFFKQLI